VSIIRHATEQDIDALTAMAREFLAYSAYGTMIAPSDDDIRAGLRAVLTAGVVFVAEVGERIVGAVVGVVAPMWFAPSVTAAVELAWWVDPAHRMTRIPFRLMHALEAWGKERGAQLMCMSELVIEGTTPVAKMLGRMGYVNTERTHVREI
jgi:GNAT superfamily N-acetyltransferase